MRVWVWAESDDALNQTTDRHFTILPAALRGPRRLVVQRRAYAYHGPMPIYLDNHPVSLVGDKLGDLLNDASTRLQATGRVIVEVHFDGQIITGKDLGDMCQAPLPPQAELRLISADPGVVAREVLDQVRDHLHEQGRLIAQAADLLQQDRSTEAFSLIHQINSAWQTTLQAIEQAAVLMGVELGTLTIADKPFHHYTTQLLTTLQQFKQHITDQDTAALADALGFEWPRLIEQWDAVLGTLIERTHDCD